MDEGRSEAAPCQPHCPLTRQCNAPCDHWGAGSVWRVGVGGRGGVWAGSWVLVRQSPAAEITVTCLGGRGTCQKKWLKESEPSPLGSWE